MPKGQYEREHGRKWTDDDILEALWMRDEGYTFKEIGVLHRVAKGSA